MTVTTAKLTRWPMVAVFLSLSPSPDGGSNSPLSLPEAPVPLTEQAFWNKHPVLLYGSHVGPCSLLKVLATTRLQIAARGKERKDLLHYSFFKQNTPGKPGTMQL